ncbi:MAG: hypothetical protein IJW21_08725 [Clostridia bacterium]|nr:hypothetical protein [Clostridia bacterium]
MSNKKQTSTKVSVTKQNKTPVWLWILAGVPVVSTVMFLAIASGSIPAISLDVFYENEAGGTSWHTSSVLVLLLTMLVWAGCGFLYGYFRAKMSVAVVAFHALPFLSTLVYTICIIIAFCGAGDVSTGISVWGVKLTVEGLGLLASAGMGLFSYIDSFVYAIIYLGYFGFYLDLVFMVLTFVVGFAIGKSRRLKA